jgi:hypothetical protein
MEVHGLLLFQKIGRYIATTITTFFAPATVIIVLIVLLTAVSSNRSIAAKPFGGGFIPLSIRLSQQTVTVGDMIILEIDTHPQRPSLKDLHIRFLDRVIPSFDHPIRGSNARISLIPIPYRSAPGVQNISIEWSDNTGYHQQPIPVAIQSGRFRSEKLTVTASRVIPPKTEMKRIEREREEIKKVYSFSEPLRHWNGTFQKPTTGKVTSPYGTQRLLNGKLQRYHSGVDFRAPLGTPIYAASNGVVRLAKNLYYSGNHVILDHGEGLFTSYSHLSRIDVSKGQFIMKGQILGQSGATGRVSGPHLHWVVKIHGVNVDPLGFMKTFNALFDNPIRPVVAEPQLPEIR